MTNSNSIIANLDKFAQEELKKQEQKNRLLLPVQELLQDLRPPEWIIKDYIPKSSLVEVFGESGTFKSFIVMDMAFCVANGIQWHGFDVKQGNVIYFAGEGFYGLKWRVLALQKHYQMEAKNFYVSKQPLVLIDKESVQNAAKEMEEIGDISMVIFDTLHRNVGPANEDTAKEWGEILHNLDYYIKPLCDVILYVHHTGHKDKERSRGTSARYASLDADYRVERDEMTITMTCTKMKDAKEPEPLSFKMEVVDVTDMDREDNETMQPITSLVPVRIKGEVKQKRKKLTKNQELFMRALRIAVKEKGEELPKEIKDRFGIREGRGARAEYVREEFYKLYESDSQASKRAAYNKLKKDLQSIGEIDFYDDYFWAKRDIDKNIEY